MTLGRAEGHRRLRKERARKQIAFPANPFGLTKQLLGQKRSIQLTCSKAEVDHHLRETIIDACYEHAEVQCRGPLTKSGVRQPPIRAFMDDFDDNICPSEQVNPEGPGGDDHLG